MSNQIGLNKVSNILYLGNKPSADGYCAIVGNKIGGHGPSIIFSGGKWQTSSDGSNFNVVLNTSNIGLDGYYNKNQIGLILDGYTAGAGVPAGLLDGYFTKSQTGYYLTDGYYSKSLIGQRLTDGYYNKNQIGIFLDGYSVSAGIPVGLLDGYFTKSQTGYYLTDGYYNKNQIGIFLDGYSVSAGIPAGLLDGYFTKSQTGYYLTDGYYNKNQVGLYLDGYSLSNYYNKNQIGTILDGYTGGSIPAGLMDGYFNKSQTGYYLTDGYYNKNQIGSFLDGYTVGASSGSSFILLGGDVDYIPTDGYTELYYKFNEAASPFQNSGTVGYAQLDGYNGLVGSGIWYNAYYCKSATGGYLSSIPGVKGTGAGLTASVWVNLKSFVGATESCIFAKEYRNAGWTSPFISYAITTTSASDGKIKISVAVGSATFVTFTTNATKILTLNEWNFIAMTYNDQTGLLSGYINGAAVGSTSTTPASIDWGTVGQGRVLLGRLPNAAGGQQLDGYVTDFRLESVPRDLAYIKAQYKAGFNKFYAIPFGYSDIFDGYYNKTQVNSLLDGYSFNNNFYLKSFVDGDLDAVGTIPITHNLNNRYVMCEVFNDDGYKVAPDFIQTINANLLNLNVKNSQPIIGTWNASIRK